VSRAFGDVVAVYAEYVWVNNSNPVSKELFDLLGIEHNDTFMVGIGGRVRIRPTSTSWLSGPRSATPSGPCGLFHREALAATFALTTNHARRRAASSLGGLSAMSGIWASASRASSSSRGAD
jgi:hypothetical protein